MALVYQINKGVSRPIEFKGLVGVYIACLAVGLVFLLVLFAALYIAGVDLYVVLVIVIGLGVGLFFTVFKLSKRFGVHGLGKFLARRGIPIFIRFSSRRLFTGLKGGGDGRG
jgi:1,4-dihydroxy-2-naphthoate octaprenyltransferase